MKLSFTHSFCCIATAKLNVYSNIQPHPFFFQSSDSQFTTTVHNNFKSFPNPIKSSLYLGDITNLKLLPIKRLLHFINILIIHASIITGNKIREEKRITS